MRLIRSSAILGTLIVVLCGHSARAQDVVPDPAPGETPAPVVDGASETDPPPEEDKYAPVVMEATPAESAVASPVPASSADDKYAPVSFDPSPGVSASGSARAGGVSIPGLDSLKLDFGGRVQGGLHYRMDDRSFGEFYDRTTLEPGIARYETTLNLQLKATLGRFRGVADIDLDWLGYGGDRFGTFDDLSRREALDPVRFEPHALYIEATDVFVDGLDIRFGQQLAQWGKADQFNPSNNVNPEDLENVLLFGQQASNLMLRADYGFLDTWSLSGVLVPIFKPAILPRSGKVALASVDRLPFVSDEFRWLVHSEREFARQQRDATVVTDVITRMPKTEAKNMQFMFRLGGELFGQDVGLSYYWGRSDIPQPVANHTEQNFTAPCDPGPGGECLDSLLESTVTLAYPRMQAVGLNVAGEIPLPFKLAPLGYRFEMGVTIPTARRALLTNGDMSVFLPNFVDQPAGEHPTTRPDGNGGIENITRDGGRPLLVSDTPFAKWTLGFDYTFNRYVYANIMWVHGFADEYGAGDFFSPGYSVRGGGVGDLSQPINCSLNRNGEECAWEILRPRIGDYLVLGVDVNLFDQRALIRLFTIFEMSGYQRTEWDPNRQERVTINYSPFSEEGFSAVIYPEVAYKFGSGFELGAGAVLNLGKGYTKFGDPATGGSLFFVQGKFAF